MTPHQDETDSAQAGRVEVQASLPLDYSLLLPKAPPRELILLLHGYAENGQIILEKLASTLPDNAAVLAPNGLFPIPRRTEKADRIGCSWYFYDRSKQDYFIDMKPAIGFLEKGVERLGFQFLPKRIVGFSQGGYLAPFVGHRLSATRQVIGIGCEYLCEEWPAGFSFRVDAIHGDQDPVVPLEEARESHELLGPRGIPGSFTLLENTGHQIDERVRDRVSQLLRWDFGIADR